jgi:L-malate glycosyltransferase
MRIFAFHLLNDYSGSPKVLMQLANGWVHNGLDVTMVTCSGREGFLSNITGVKYVEYWYRWAANPYLRLINLTISQIILFLSLVRKVKKDDIIYVNTVLPFGASFLGKLKGCRVIYHIHEISMKPLILKKILFGLMRWAARDIIYVSNFLATQEHIANKNIYILPNAIEDKFLKEAQTYLRVTKLPKNILMVCSLKPYKGVNEFIELAKLNLHFQFQLVVNATQQDIDTYIKDKSLSDNLEIFPVQTNLHPFYNWADVILNLSNPDSWIETFGLTIIEGMAHSLPAIVPPVGGIAELVENGVNGFCVDSREVVKVSQKLNELCEPANYERMKKKARDKIDSYSESIFLKKNLKIIGSSANGIPFHHMEKSL